jgi:thiol:disulfide interchange protein
MRVLLALLLLTGLIAEDSFFSRHGVTVSVELETTAEGPVIAATFQPRPQDPPLHLYGMGLAAGGAGVPTSLRLAPGSPVRARGPLRDDQPVHDLDGLPVYPDGTAVTLRLPITAPAGSGEIPVEVRVSYMACTAEACLVPVNDAPLVLRVPGDHSAPAATGGGASLDDIRAVIREELAGTQAKLRSELRAELAAAAEPLAIRWRRPADRAAAEALIAEAHAAGKAAILDFTGPSCINCLLMAKTVFRVPAVARAWNSGVPIEIDTDPPHEDLAAWQQERFATQNRPLYIRIAPDGSEARWDRVFDPSDTATLERLVAFLERGESAAGDATGTGSGWGEFLLLAVLGGLFTLVMPCTYPMIPFTVNMFTKQAAGGAKLLPLAAAYALGIIACFVGLGVLITGVFGASLTTLAGHPITNLLIGVLFVVLGLSLLGAWFLTPPSWLQNAAGGARGGYVGALLMGLTFAITAFTCTAPFAGAVLAAGVAHGAWGSAVLGMAVYSGTIALPFFLLALAPGWLARLPRAGAWMNEFKVVGGLVEIAAACKFLAICDHAWGWGIIGRTFCLASWSAIALAIAAYVLGWWRHDGDERIEHAGLGRLSAAIICAALAIWLASGLAGNHLGLIESFFPGDQAP